MLRYFVTHFSKVLQGIYTMTTYKASSAEFPNYYFLYKPVNILRYLVIHMNIDADSCRIHAQVKDFSCFKTIKQPLWILKYSLFS